MHVDGFGRQLERVATAAHGDELGRAQRASQLRREALETVAHGRRRILAPQRVDDLFRRDDPAHVQRQDGEERPQLRARDHDVAPVVVEHLEPAQQPDAHGRDGTPPSARPQRDVSLGSAPRPTLRP